MSLLKISNVKKRTAASDTLDRPGVAGRLTNGVPWVHLAHPRRKRIALVINREGVVEIRTPLQTRTSVALGFLQQHQDWAANKIAAMNVRSTDSWCRVLGVDYPLKTGADETHFSDGVLRTPSQAKLDHFLRQKLTTVITQRWAELIPIIESWDVPQPTWTLRKMKSRWGSCSMDGRIRFSTLLIHHAIEQIDYVIVHELCHLREMNHSPAYWRLVESAMPDWRQRRARLAER